ncbi:hypothetical protein AAFF_G00358840 [Aldrovandia affinis]|uniref:KIND domain-containing protein n=1 Tax=Aldrovandia affinis TaxID=143900 RepID=A0AAD7SI48_9TELE|nr:hypothetical protein AAFF_G00358840 [Aldrovandia affinis]
MAKRRDADEGKLIAPGIQQDHTDGPTPEAVDMDCGDGGDELSLEEILILYGQPINEEQAWAVCYQCCRSLAHGYRRRRSESDKAPVVDYAGRIEGPGDVRIRKDGTVRLQHQGGPDTDESSCTPVEGGEAVIESLGIMIYKALDYGLKENVERELSPPLEQLIDLMTNMAESERDACPDEGYEATEEEDEGEEDPAEGCNVHGYRDVLKLCTSHLPSSSDVPSHYQAVCRALYAETKELRTFLEKIKSAKENLRKMEGRTAEEPVRELNELQNADWARFWVQVMRDLRTGVKLKKVQERQYDPLPIEFQLTPYEMLMNDIRSKRYKLRKVMVNGDIPPRLKKSAHEVILEFIRSRPPLNPVSARKLKPYPHRPPSLHERILEEIKAERKLRPVSPEEIRRSRLGVYTPDAPKKRPVSTLALANGTTSGPGHRSVVDGAQALSQRKRLLKAPTLAELNSSDSDEESTCRSASNSSMSTSLMDDTSPESVVGKKTPPMFLPISSTPQPEKRLVFQRRHSIEKETPTNLTPFVSFNNQVAVDPSPKSEEFCYPVECLALTVEEVMHIRQVLVKAELEKFQQYKDVYSALKKGKLCFSCRTKRFSFFTWAYTCQFCKRSVCSQCCKKMRLPSKPFANLPIYSLGSSPLPREEATTPPDKASASPQHQGLQQADSRVAKLGERPCRDDGELHWKLTEDWSTMDVCVDCKKFISEIISSSKRSLATERARLMRKTQSFRISSPKSADYRPSEHTISEV